MIIRLRLPFPPSENAYRRCVKVGRFCRAIISKAGREYRDTCIEAIHEQTEVRGLVDRLQVTYEFHKGDRRKYDPSNFLKALDDAMEASGLFVDDEQIDVGHFSKEAIAKGDPHVVVTICTWKR